MSLKQNVEYIKEGIDNDEKMLEGLLRFEGWFRRNKNIIIALVILILFGFIGYEGNKIYTQNKENKIALAYENALNGDKTALETLKSSKSKLYDLYQFQEALKNKDIKTLKALGDSKDLMIAKLAKYQYATLSKNQQALITDDLETLGYLQSALIDIQNKKYKEAKQTLEKIQNNPQTGEIANALGHLNIQGNSNEK